MLPPKLLANVVGRGPGARLIGVPGDCAAAWLGGLRVEDADPCGRASRGLVGAAVVGAPATTLARSGAWSLRADGGRRRPQDNVRPGGGPASTDGARSDRPVDLLWRRLVSASPLSTPALASRAGVDFLAIRA